MAAGELLNCCRCLFKMSLRRVQMDAGLRGIAPGEQTERHLATLDSKLALIGGAPPSRCRCRRLCLMPPTHC